MQNPFGLDNTTAYLRWRDNKLAHAITSIDELIVEIRNPRSLSAAEHTALMDRCRRSNMAIYASRAEGFDENAVRQLGQQLGLNRIDANWLASDHGVTRITVCEEDGLRQAFIPYTKRAIKWHTDGYYNAPEQQVHSLLLHCAQSARHGGENRLMDHEIAYLILREANSDFIRALSEPDAMTIPERIGEQGVARAAQTGPVYSVNPVSGRLHMRYTARTKSIMWKQEATTLAAVAMLEKLLASDSQYIHRALLEPGMGLVSNNVLHDRAAFADNATAPRLLYRARYYDRINGT